MDNTAVINTVKSQMTEDGVIRYGKCYVIAPATEIRKLTCDDVYLGRYQKHDDWWVQYGKAGGCYSLDEDLFDITDETKLVVKRIVADLTGDTSINTKAKQSKPRKQPRWHYIKAKGYLYATDGWSVIPLGVYEYFCEAVADDGKCVMSRYSFFKFCEDFIDWHCGCTHCYDFERYIPMIDDGYEDEENSIYFVDLYEDENCEELECLTKKVLEIRAKYCEATN